MANHGDGKLKILYLYKILEEETDEERGLSMPHIIKRLAEYGIKAERKSLYTDIEILRSFDVDIKTFQRNPVEYAIVRRGFTLGELMLMVDAIESCRTITERQARMLTSNIKMLASNRQQDKLNRRIHVVGRVKSKSDCVFDYIDVLHEARRLGCMVAFSYRKMNIDGTRCDLRGAARRQVTPVEISYDDGFYYLTAWDDQRECMIEYRVDRMVGLTLCLDVPAAENIEIAEYSFNESDAVSFGRFNDGEITAHLSAAADKIEIITDRFGSSSTFLAPDNNRAQALVRVCKSEQFFGWIAGMGGNVRIEGPQELVQEYRSFLQRLLNEL